MIKLQHASWTVSGLLLIVATAGATGPDIQIGANIVSPTIVEATAVTEVLFTTATGVLTVTVPGPTGTAVAIEVAPLQLFSCAGLVQSNQDNMLTCLWPTSPLATEGAPPDPQIIAQLVVNDGTLNGSQGVSLSIAEGENAQIVATVAYN
jgi:hypothetical protein